LRASFDFKYKHELEPEKGDFWTSVKNVQKSQLSWKNDTCVGVLRYNVSTK